MTFLCFSFDCSKIFCSVCSVASPKLTEAITHLVVSKRGSVLQPGKLLQELTLRQPRSAFCITLSDLLYQRHDEPTSSLSPNHTYIRGDAHRRQILGGDKLCVLDVVRKTALFGLNNVCKVTSS